MSKPRLLILDIETKPLVVASFGIRDQHITHKQIMERGGTICVGYKWYGEKPVHVLSDWEHGHDGMVRGTHALLEEADAVITYNGARFDIPKLMGEFVLAGLDPPPPPTQIDIYKAARKLGWECNKLDYVAQLLGLGSKVKHEGLDMWLAVMAGDTKAQDKMARYCAGDIRLTERVYKRLLPYIPNHPHLGFTASHSCGACGSTRTQSRGVHRTKASYVQRIHCQACGSWQLGKRSKAA